MSQDTTLVLNQDKGFNVSEKYVAVKTQGIVETLEARGFSVTAHSKKRVRDASKEGFQKHLVRMSHNEMTLRGVGDSRPELVIVNAHDGTSSVRLMLGIFRLVCSNGLIVGNTFGGYNIRHSGNALERLDVGLVALTDALPEVNDTIERWSNIKVSDYQQRIFAVGASRLILGEDSGASADVDSMLRVRRTGDADSNLWSVYNRIQESMIRGGIRYTKPTFDDHGGILNVKGSVTRAVRSIDRQVSLNRNLWNLTQDVAAEVA